MSILETKRFEPRFRIRAPLRCDGVGKLDWGEDTSSGERVAVRWMPLKANGAAAASACGELPVHPVLPKILQSGQTDVLAFLAMEFPDGELLARRLAELKQGTAQLAQLDERLVTVVRIELVGLAARLARPPTERLVALMGEFQHLCTQLVFSFQGTVTGFTADGAEVVFGAPYQRGDDAIRAVRSALALRAGWARKVESMAEEDRVPLRVGLTTGRAMAGTTGSEHRLDFQVIGEPPTLAGLVAASAEPGQVLVTSKTLAAIGARFDVSPLGERALHGSKQRTPLYEVMDEDLGSGTLSGVR